MSGPSTESCQSCFALLMMAAVFISAWPGVMTLDVVAVPHSPIAPEYCCSSKIRQAAER